MININVFSEEKAWSKRIKNKNLFFQKICKAFPKKYKFLNKNKKIIPLSGIANKKTILCLDKNDKPIIYKSDKFGFNNDDYQKEINILVLGDSYVHGQCVNNKTNLIGQMNELGKKAKLRAENDFTWESI